MSGSGYDPKIIERFADQLLRKADTVRVGFAAGGGIFGVFVGAVPLTPLQSVWGIPAGFGVATIIVGALLGILLGYVVGEGRAFRYRVQAQSAIFQLEIERRVTAAVAEAVTQGGSPPPTPVAEAPPQATEPPPAEPPAEPPVEPPAVEPSPSPPVSAPPLTSVDTPPLSEPLLRPPGTPAPPAGPTPEELPPLSPAANG
jgi:hypothetical protein